MLETPRSAPRLAGAHSTLASTFHGLRVLSNSDPVFLFVFCTCLDQAGARFGRVCLEGSCLEACKLRTSWTCPDQTGARKGSGLGSRPLASLDLALAGRLQS